MGKFFLESETVKIDFPDGSWIAIKEELTQEDQDYILNQMAHAEQNGKTPRVELAFGQLSLLEKAITDWSFTGGDNQKVPINRDTISHLRRRYRDKILVEINRLNIQAAEFSKK